MAGAGETFDVVVVGVTAALRGDGDEGVVAEDLAGITGLPRASVKLALNQGELVVHRRLGAVAAKSAASELRELGAMVETRGSEDTVDMPIIEDDPQEVPQLISGRFDLPGPGLDIGGPALDVDSLGLGVPEIPAPARAGIAGAKVGGGKPRSIAPPPDFGSVPGPPPARRASVDSPADPSRPHGRPAQRAERPFVLAADESQTQRFGAGPATRSRGRRGPAATEIQDLDAPTSRHAPVAEEASTLAARSPEARAPAPRPVARAPEPAAPAEGERSAFDSLVGHLEAAASGTAPMGVVTLDGLSNDAAQAAEQPELNAAAAPKNEPVAAAPSSASMSAGGAANPFAPPEAEGSLALETAGTAAAASGSGSGFGASASVSAAASRTAASSQFSGTYAASSGSFAGAAAFERVAVAGDDAPRNLFVSDLVANYLVGVTLGVIVAVIVALASRGADRDLIDRLEVEIAEAYIRPLAVASGEVQSPKELTQQLDDAYGDSRKTFLLKMLLIGVPLGLGMGRIRLG